MRTKDVNAALLAKLAWKIVNHADIIQVKVNSTKYLNKASFLKANKTTKASTKWKCILDCRYLIKKGIY